MADSLFGRGSLDARLSLTNGCRPGRGFRLGDGAGTGRGSAGLGGSGRSCLLLNVRTRDRCRGSSRRSLSWSSCARRRCHGVCGHTSVRGSTVVRIAAAPVAAVATAAAIPTIAAAATIVVAAAPAAAPAVPGLRLLCIRNQGDSHHRKERSNSTQKRTTHVAPPWNKRLYVLFPQTSAGLQGRRRLPLTPCRCTSLAAA